jgi:hypothetical protein
MPTEHEATATQPEVFISHSVRDKAAVDLLADLVSSMGMGQIDVFSSSSPGFDIPAGTPFFHHIEKMLRRSAFIIQFVTPAFLDSDFCMLEVGAALAQDKAFPILIPPLTVRDLAGSPLTGLQLTDLPAGLDQLMDRIADLTGRRPRTHGWFERRDRAVRDITKALAPPSPAPVTRLASVGTSGYVDLWTLKGTGQLTNTYWPHKGGEQRWSEPEDFGPISGAANIADIAVGSCGSGHEEIFAIDNQGKIFHRRWNPDDGWVSWDHFPAPIASPPLAACSSKRGHLQVFATKRDTRSVIYCVRNSDGAWSEWIELDEGLEPA